MIYFDNAATTLHKPPEVETAVCRALRQLGNAGRGAHMASLDASRSLYAVRERLADFFHCERPQCVAFTMNATESLNMAIQGLLEPGDHIIATAADHNSVLRPCYMMEALGVSLTIIGCDRMGRLDYDQMESSIQPNTKAIIITHASNVTGNVYDIARISSLAHRHGCVFILDAAQTAGILDLDVQKMEIDILCFTGHKGLMGPQGTGGICVREGIALRPLLSGGTGVHSYSRSQPSDMPTLLEAGTPNGHGLAGLGAAAEFIARIGPAAIRAREDQLAQRFLTGLASMDGIKLYGDFLGPRVSVISLNLQGYDAAAVSDALFAGYGIATRAGAHCAPRMHEALGTVHTGTVRFSFSYFNTEEEVDQALAALAELAESAERNI